ncbi:CHAT domain-containing protein [Streptomyces sp. NPDC048523]|uniref:CHAT domain-containing protein n=1 Tax=Streptomyces sp. NPDC048523 TaxID=3365567 RepID=UPI00371E7ECC
MARDRDTPVPSQFPGALIRQAARRSRNRLAAHWNDRAAVWMERAEGRAAGRRLRRAERLLRRAIGVTASDRARRHFHLNLSLLLQQRHELSLSDGPSDAVEAVMAARHALAGLSAEEAWWCDALCTLADALLLVHATDPDVGTGTGSEEAVQCLVRAVADVPDGFDELPILVVRLGNALETWVDSGAADTDRFDRSIGVARDAVAEVTGDEQPTARLALAQVLCSVALAAGWTAALDEGIGIYRDLARELPADSGVLHALGTALLLRDEVGHAPDAVAEGLDALRAAVSAADLESAERRAVEQDLGAALHISYEHTGDLMLLDEAITLLSATVDGPPDGEPGLSVRRLRLGIVLDARATRTGEAGDAREAAELLRQALADPAVEEDDEELAGVLLALANALLTLAELTGEPGLVPKAVGHLRTAAHAATGTLLRVRIHSGLSSALRSSFTQGGPPTDLDDAVTAGRTAVRLAGDGTGDLPACLTNLANALADQFDRTGTGAPELLDEAIVHARAAVAGSWPGRPGHGGSLSCLGVCLTAEYESVKDLSVLTEAVQQHREALRVTASDDVRRPGYLSNAATALGLLHEHTSDADALAEAVEAAREAVATAAEHDPDRHLYLQVLARVLRERHFAARRAAEPHSGIYLHQALEAGRRAVRSLPSGAPTSAACWGNLAADLLLSHQEGLSEDDGDLTEALALLTGEAAALSPGTPERALSLYNLGLARVARYESTHDGAELPLAVTAFTEAETITAASPMLRAEAALEHGRAAAAAHQWRIAVEGFERALDLLPLLPFARLDRGDQEYVLTVFAGLGRDAAACLLACPGADPRRAVELAEQGRGVLLDAMFYPESEVAALRRIAPDPAERFERLRDRLDARRSRQWSRRSGSAVRHPGPPAGRESADSRKALAAELDDVVGQIRALDGMAHFARAPAVGELLDGSLADQGPVVVVNVSRYRSDALVLTGDGVRVVPLPGLTPDRLDRAVALHLHTLRAIRATGGRDRANRHRMSERLAEVCAWLWHSVAGPVLDALELTPREHGRPRLWWCPTGPLTLLPLHAAQRYDARLGRDDGVPDRAISSYTPTLRALATARRPRPTTVSLRDRGSDGDVLVASVARVPGLRPLAFAEDEVAAVSDACPRTPEVLQAGGATREAVTVGLTRHRCWHFIGHSRQDLLNSGLAAIRLADGELTALDLASLRLHGAELAYLSSCESATTGTGVPDEPLHLALSCQIAGYRHTVGTMWSVLDHSAAEMAGLFYTNLTVDGRLAPETAADALHKAVMHLRRTSPMEVWAAYLHAGT